MEREKTSEYYLRQLPRFKERSAAQVAGLARHVKVESFERNSILFDQGADDARLFILVSGEVAFLGKISSDEWFTLETVDEGAVFGEVACFSSGVRSARAVAKSDCIALTADQAAVSEIIRLEPELAKDLLVTMAHRLQRMSVQLKTTVPTVRQALQSTETPLDRSTDQLVRTLGQYWMVGVQLALIAVALGLSVSGRTQTPKPLYGDSDFWGLVLGGLAMLIAALVLASERRQREDAKRRDEIWDQWRMRVEDQLNEFLRRRP